MALPLHRRDFLRLTAAGAAAGGVPSLLSCSPAPSATTAQVFPQGVASGDPRPDSVVIWTRVEAPSPADQPVAYELSRDADFTRVVAAGTAVATANFDHTVRVKIVGLQPHTAYNYRFIARGASSPVGQTRTAPRPDQDVAVRFAVACCQDFVGRHYHSWRVLAEQDDPVDFVLFLGDYIYETTEVPPLQLPAPGRTIDLPDGLPLDPENPRSRAALTLADYRALYRQYRTDPDLQRVHQRFPFITIWDDHEFANDCWQDHSVHFDEARGDERNTARREAATRAWFEYIPTDLRYEPQRGFPEDLRIYRAFRYGQHLELLLTDQRYYRSDHVIPEGSVDPAVGKLQRNSPLGSRIFARKQAFDERERAAAPTMLGQTQHDWLVDALQRSTASWKAVASQTIVAQMLLDLAAVDGAPQPLRDRYYFKLDQWDGFRSERAALLEKIAAIDDVVALTGDIHAFYAAELHADFDRPGERPAAVEYITASISAISLQEQVQAIVDSDPLLSGLGLGQLVPRFDRVLMESNPHFRFARSQSYGYMLVELDRPALQTTYVIVGDPRQPSLDGPVERVVFRTPAGSRRILRTESPPSSD